MSGGHERGSGRGRGQELDRVHSSHAPLPRANRVRVSWLRVAAWSMQSSASKPCLSTFDPAAVLSALRRSPRVSQLYNDHWYVVCMPPPPTQPGPLSVTLRGIARPADSSALNRLRIEADLAAHVSVRITSGVNGAVLLFVEGTVSRAQSGDGHRLCALSTTLQTMWY